MRLVAWNCRLGLTDKSQSLRELTPDLAIVAEVKSGEAQLFGANYAWTGNEGALGLALFGFNGWTLDKVYEAPDRHVLAAKARRGSEQVLLVGVWTLPIGRDYVAPLVRAWSALSPLLKGDVIVAGDFNANPVWDERCRVQRQEMFAPFIGRLHQAGLRSLWHERNGEVHGDEKTPTFYWYLHENKPFHIDYVFASGALRRRAQGMTIGTYNDWIATKRSDHVPIIVEFADSR